MATPAIVAMADGIEPALHPVGSNAGDCFSYALGKTGNLPLLFKGDDFIHTDIEPALKPARRTATT